MSIASLVRVKAELVRSYGVSLLSQILKISLSLIPVHFKRTLLKIIHPSIFITGKRTEELEMKVIQHDQDLKQALTLLSDIQQVSLSLLTSSSTQTSFESLPIIYSLSLSPQRLIGLQAASPTPSSIKHNPSLDPELRSSKKVSHSSLSLSHTHLKPMMMIIYIYIYNNTYLPLSTINSYLRSKILNLNLISHPIKKIL